MIDSYLLNRKQVVKLNGIFSDKDFITNGVPQGSNLGPTLFLVYFNDLMNIDFRGFLNLFADDLCIAVSNKDPLKICEDLNHDFLTNRLIVNVKKTKADVFWKNKSSVVPLDNIYLNGQVVEPVSEYTYLGFTLDDKLTFYNHAKS